MYSHLLPKQTPGIVYQVVANYESQGIQSCIRCQKNDLIFVKKPFCFDLMLTESMANQTGFIFDIDVHPIFDTHLSELSRALVRYYKAIIQGTELDPEGWLYGLNLETNETGFILGKFVTFVREITLQNMHQLSNPEVTSQGPFRYNSLDDDNPPPVTPRRVTSKLRSPTTENTYVPLHPRTDLSPPFPSSPRRSYKESQALTEYEWYWGNASKDEVKQRLTDEPDGTFLVRNSTNNPNEYTLTLCKGGNLKLIRICQRDGMYGFSEPFVFSSVVQLINYFKREPLTPFNPELNITLKYPASVTSSDQVDNMTVAPNDMDQLWQSLREVDQMFVQKSNEYDEKFSDFSKRQQDIQSNKTAIIGYEEAIQMFNDQCGKLSECLDNARGKRDEQRLLENFRRMQARLKAIVSQCMELRVRLNEDTHINGKLDQELNACKEEMLRIKKLRDDRISYIKSRRVSENLINRHLKFKDEEETTDSNQIPVLDTAGLQRRFPDHCHVDNWYFPDFGRQEAAIALHGAEDGTFLIRDKDDPKAPYACSLVAGGCVNHCLIERTPDGYGFAEPFNLHPTLSDLVLHYANNSLLPHNETLDTTLAVPIRCARR